MQPRDSKGRFVGNKKAKNNDLTAYDPTANDPAGNYELVIKIPGFYYILIWALLLFILSPWILKIYQPICYLYKLLGFVNDVNVNNNDRHDQPPI